MDMVLYSLLKKEIASTPKDKVDNVGGYEIRFVNAIPSTREAKTLYFVLGEGHEDDNVVIGKQGLRHIVYEDTMIDFAVLNGNIFLNRYDDNRDIHRELFDAITEPIICQNSAPYDIHYFTIQGNGVSNLTKVTLGNQTIELDRDLIGIYNGSADELDMLTGRYIHRMTTARIDGKITWQNIGASNGYRIFKAISYTGAKPLILKTNGLYNNEDLQNIALGNSFITGSDFVTAIQGDTEKECVYVNNGSLYLSIDTTKITTGSGTTYASSLQSYLSAHPIILHVALIDEIVEEGIPTVFIALNGTTEVNLTYSGDCPRTIVEMPVRN